MEIEPKASGAEYAVHRLLYVCLSETHARAFKSQHGAEYGEDGIDSVPSDLDSRGSRRFLKRKVLRFFGKRIPGVSRVASFFKSLLWLFGLAATEKLGAPDHVAVLDGELLLEYPTSWLDVLDDLNDSLRGYYSLFAVTFPADEVPKRRREVYGSGVPIVLATPFVRADLDDQAFLVRAIGQDALTQRRSSIWNNLWIASRGVAFGLVMVMLGIVMKDCAANLRNLDSCWSCQITSGEPASRQDSTGVKWERFTLEIANKSMFPKQGFEIEAGNDLRTRCLPARVGERLGVGETIKIDFLVADDGQGLEGQVIEVRGPGLCRPPVQLELIREASPPPEPSQQPPKGGGQKKSPPT